MSNKEDQYMIVGMMKDEKLKLRGLHPSDTLGCSGPEKNICLLWIKKARPKDKNLYMSVGEMKD